LASLSLEAPEAVKDKHAAFRTVTGVLTSRPTSRDIKIDGFSMTLNGNNLIQDCSIELTIGRRCAPSPGLLVGCALMKRRPAALDKHPCQPPPPPRPRAPRRLERHCFTVSVAVLQRETALGYRTR
jgi:hypothetical protein